MKDNKEYYRASGGGGLPYKVDHLAKFIQDMIKLRNYNDSFSMEQIMYQYFLLSHYVVDAHVPMHCDLRDDKPSTGTDNKKPQKGKYYKDSWHGTIEELWDKACTPVGIMENILERERAQDNTDLTTLSPFVTFDIDKDVKAIQIYNIQSSNLMEYMINLCIQTKERSLKLFPISDPDSVNLNDDNFKKATREIFASAIGNLISIWTCMYQGVNVEEE